MTIEVPYPADTRAKGWRFEIDYEKVEQSDTWSLAAEIPMAQHSLLMMWLISWTQVPCGSFPNDEGLIRAKCRIAPKTWNMVGPILMRGWWLADDGRLYHDTIVLRVREMLEYRRKEAERRGRNRAKAPGEQGLSRGTTAGQQQDTSGVPDTGTGTLNTFPNGKGGEPPADDLPKAELWKAGKSLLESQGTPKAQCGSFVGKLVKDYGDEIVIEAVRSAVVKRPPDAAGYLVATCQRMAGLRKASEPAWRSEQRERTQLAAPGVASNGIPADQFFIDIEAKNVAPNLLA